MRHGGTHLVKPVLSKLVGKWQGGKWRTALEREALGPTVVVTRDPRNRAVSAFRWKNKGRTRQPGIVETDKALAKYLTAVKDNTGTTIMEFMHAWADRWMGLDGVHYSRFEDFISGEKYVIRAINKIANHAGIETTPAEIKHWYYSVYKGVGFSGQHSNYRQWFGPRTTEAWIAAGGEELVRKMGYTNADE